MAKRGISGLKRATARAVNPVLVAHTIALAFNSSAIFLIEKLTAWVIVGDACSWWMNLRLTFL